MDCGGVFRFAIVRCQTLAQSGNFQPVLLFMGIVKEMLMRSDMPKGDTKNETKKDAAGQYAPSQADGKSSGVASAKPTVITGSEDATANKLPPGTEKSAKWRE
jgi:hypothetical protein